MGRGEALHRAPPPSAPRVRTPQASCPQAAEPGQCLAPSKTAQSCLEPLFFGTRGGFLLPSASPCAWRSGVTRAGAGRGQPSRRDLGAHKDFFLCRRAGKAAPGAGRQLGSSITPTATGHLSPCPKPGSALRVLARVSVLPLLPSRFSHGASPSSSGGLCGAPLAQQGGGGGG